MLSIMPTRFCYICGKSLADTDSVKDEHGFPLHAGCYALKKTLQEAALQTTAKAHHRLRADA